MLEFKKKLYPLEGSSQLFINKQIDTKQFHYLFFVTVANYYHFTLKPFLPFNSVLLQNENENVFTGDCGEHQRIKREIFCYLKSDKQAQINSRKV